MSSSDSMICLNYLFDDIEGEYFDNYDGDLLAEDFFMPQEDDTLFSAKDQPESFSIDLIFNGSKDSDQSDDDISEPLYKRQRPISVSSESDDDSVIQNPYLTYANLFNPPLLDYVADFRFTYNSAIELLKIDDPDSTEENYMICVNHRKLEEQFGRISSKELPAKPTSVSYDALMNGLVPNYTPFSDNMSSELRDFVADYRYVDNKAVDLLHYADNSYFISVNHDELAKEFGLVGPMGKPVQRRSSISSEGVNIIKPSIYDSLTNFCGVDDEMLVLKRISDTEYRYLICVDNVYLTAEESKYKEHNYAKLAHEDHTYSKKRKLLN